MISLCSVCLMLAAVSDAFGLQPARSRHGTVIRRAGGYFGEAALANSGDLHSCLSHGLDADVCRSILRVVDQEEEEAGLVDFYIAFGDRRPEDFAVFSFTYTANDNSRWTPQATFYSSVEFHRNLNIRILAFFDAADQEVREIVLARVMARHGLLETELGERAAAVFFPELNVPVYHCSFVLSLAALASADDATFLHFKSKHSTSKYIWNVFFAYWESNRYILQSSMAEMFRKFPHLFGFSPLLSAVDISVGSPDTVIFNMCSVFAKSAPAPYVFTPAHHAVLMRHGCITDPSQLHSQSDSVIQMSKVQARYLLEISLLEDTFGSLDGMHVLEIGGGFGGMAVSMQIIYKLLDYSIVDLASAGRLQKRYISKVVEEYAASSDIQNLLPLPIAMHRDNKMKVNINTISAVSEQNVSSDLVISFFAIAEQKSSEVNRYLIQYIANAPRGYLQLNYDQPEYDLSQNRLDIMFSPIELFRLVYSIHPTAVLLPGLNAVSLNNSCFCARRNRPHSFP